MESEVRCDVVGGRSDEVVVSLVMVGCGWARREGCPRRWRGMVSVVVDRWRLWWRVSGWLVGVR